MARSKTVLLTYQILIIVFRGLIWIFCNLEVAFYECGDLLQWSFQMHISESLGDGVWCTSSGMNTIREKVGKLLQNWTAAIVNKVYVARGEQFLIGHHGNCECCWSLGEKLPLHTNTVPSTAQTCAAAIIKSQVLNTYLFHKLCKASVLK